MSDLKPLYEKLSPILRDQARYEYTDELAGAIIDAIAPEIEAPFLARIAELEAMHRRDVDCIKRASIRISELEAENKALREALKRARPSISRPGGSIPWDELAALDAAWAARIERSMERSDE